MGINYDKNSFLAGLVISQVLRGYFGNGMKPPANTKAVLNLSSSNFLTQNIYFTQSQANGVTIDWGDGSATETVTDLSAHASHTYSRVGEYIIRFIVDRGVTWSPGATITSGGEAIEHGFITPSSNEKDEDNVGLVMFMFGRGTTLQQPGAFFDCKALRSVNIPEVTHIPERTFRGCENLKIITFPSSVVSVGDYAFASCKSADFASIIPQLTGTIGAHAFEHCERISEDIEIRATSVGTCAFGYCTRLRHAWIRDTVQILDVNVTTVSDTTSYYGPFYQCNGWLVLYPECTQANKPVGWATGFDYDKTTNSETLIVFWNQDHKPTISLKSEWNCHGRILTLTDDIDRQEGYVYSSSILTIY